MQDKALWASTESLKKEEERRESMGEVKREGSDQAQQLMMKAISGAESVPCK